MQVSDEGEERRVKLLQRAMEKHSFNLDNHLKRDIIKKI